MWKNEYLFDRILLTVHRRNYADIQVLQEGNIIPKDQRLAIMGLPIDKSTLSNDVKKDLQKILYEDIMTADNIDQIGILKKLVILENSIYNSIMKGDTKYYKPDNIASINSYSKDPYQINGIVAAMIYNELKDDDQPAIDLEERNSIIKVKLNISKKNVGEIKDSDPVMYEKLVKMLNHPKLGAKFNVIGFPPDTKIPDWVLHFVDFTSIISDSLKNFPLDSIGLNRLDNDSVNYSNIISL